MPTDIIALNIPFNNTRYTRNNDGIIDTKKVQTLEAWPYNKSILLTTSRPHVVDAADPCRGYHSDNIIIIIISGRTE